MHLLLIGGGEIGAPKADGTFRPLETLEIDHYFLSMINKTNPNILFIPTAIEKIDPNCLYERGFKNLYEKKLHCNVDVLQHIDNNQIKKIQEKIDKCDGIYISGGDTGYMLQRWQQSGFDKILMKIAFTNKPIAGISAGAMCWFDKVLTENSEKKLNIVKGLNVFKNMCIPHWNKFRTYLNDPINRSFPFIAIDNCCAIEIKDKKINIIRANETASAYFYKDEISCTQKITIDHFI